MILGFCPVKSIVLLIFDEAHKAQGEYSYTTVVKQIAAVTRHFRVIGLTATPGTDKKAIQGVISNLMINKLECKEDSDVDVKKYIQEKKVEIVNVKMNDCLSAAVDLFGKTAKLVIDPLVAVGAFYNKNPLMV
jgi:ERCC4-related helicase